MISVTLGFSSWISFAISAIISGVCNWSWRTLASSAVGVVIVYWNVPSSSGTFVTTTSEGWIPRASAIEISNSEINFSSSSGVNSPSISNSISPCVL